MISDIKKLRQITGMGVVECQKALEEAGGDFDKAITIINKSGWTKAGKRGGRTTGAGLLKSYIHNERVGVLLELRCETDFVAKNHLFKELADNLAMQIVAMNPEDIDELLKLPYIKDESLVIDEVIKQSIAKIGENIRIERFCVYEI